MSNEHDGIEPDFEALKPIEHTLARFAPLPAAIDRDRLMFQAGRASAQAMNADRQEVLSTRYSVLGTYHAAENDPPHATSRPWLWPAATATLAATSLALLASLLLRPAPPSQFVTRNRTITIPSQAAPSQPVLVAAEEPGMPRFRPVAPQASPFASNNYVHTREVALRLGLDALGSASSRRSDPAATATYWELLESIAHPQMQSPE